MKRALVVLSLAGILASAPRPVAAQGDRWERQVARYLTQVAGQLAPDGFAGERRQAGALDTGERDSLAADLRAGVVYVLAGVCDEDCTELELAVYSPNGYEVAAARSAGSAPIVRLTPRAAGRFTVRILMAGCGLNPCRYGVELYRR